MNYKNMPHFIDQNGIQWNVNAFHIFKSLDERGLEIECASSDYNGLKFFIYRATVETLSEYDPEEVCHSVAQAGAFWENCKNLFKDF